MIASKKPEDKPGLEPGFSRPEDDEKTTERFARLNALGASLSKTRKEAINARAASGIEQIWREDQEHYEGIDDVNRGVIQSSWQSKPPGQARYAPDSRSTDFVNITRPYVDAASAKFGDMLLPSDERGWSLTETPIPELLEKAKGALPPEVMAGMQESGIPQETIDQVAQVEAAEAAKMVEEAKEKAKKAEKRIEDWHIEGQFHAEVRKGLRDCCRIGSAVLKGPVPMTRRRQMYKDDGLVMVAETKPVSKRINPWNFYPDPACGDSIHNGRFVWERDRITPKQLDALKLDEGYIKEQIEECLKEGPMGTGEQRTTVDGKVLDDKDLFEIWYYHGQAEAEDMEAAGCKCEEGARIPAMFVMVNDRVIKGALNPLDTGEFPYDVMPWQKLENMPWGYGVGRQIRTPQRYVVGATRTMMTNAGRAAGPVFVIRNNVVAADGTGSNDITPWKVFIAAPDETMDDAQKAMAMHAIPDMQASLMNIINFALKMAEDVTGLPLLLQGQTGNAPDTYGGQQLVQENASGVMRQVARTYDDCITEPHIRRYYAWLLQYGEDDEKGEFVIDARGSTALVERDIYKQELQLQLQASLNPAFGLNPEKIMEELLRVSKRDPKKLMLTDEEKQAQQQAAQQQPANPALEVAKVRQETETQKLQANQQAAMAELEAKAAEAQRERDHELQIENIRFQTAMMKLSESRGMGFDKIKADLAKTTMTLKVSKDLSREGARAKNMPKPPVEPPGKAPPGRSYPK